MKCGGIKFSNTWQQKCPRMCVCVILSNLPFRPDARICTRAEIQLCCEGSFADPLFA